MRILKKKLLPIFFIFFVNNLYADNPYFIDFSKVLNQSQAGATAQEQLKKKFDSESKKFNKEEEAIKKKEVDLISQKKVLSNEDYQTKLESLRKEVALLQQAKQDSLNSIAQSRALAKQKLIEAINPIIKKDMEENNIRLIIDKQSVVLGDTTLEITNKIIELLNQNLKSIKF